ncbi:MAG: dUTP pyrophosphatase, partial [Mycobacterium sp.]|nr:dUTP pyrophosphatase [Mycobacterium sp.]
AKGSQFGRLGTPMLTSTAISAANPKPTGHHHHGTHKRSLYRTVCGVTGVADTRPRVICAPVSTSLAVVRLDPGLPLPARAHHGDAGVDLYSAEDVNLAPGQRALVRTGIAVAIPAGMVGLVHPRSGLAARVGLSIVNSPGTIDAGYRGEIKVSLINLDPVTPIVVSRGDRIAQLLVQRVELLDLVEVPSFDEAGMAETSRGDGGHGSSADMRVFDGIR